jgi:uncharacterized protein YukJ
MPLKNYGVLKSRALNRKLGEGPSPHYQVLVTDNKQKHRIAINVKSKQSPSELLYLVDENFSHPMTKELLELDFGFYELPRKPGGIALDYIRGNLFDPKQMKPLPYNVPGPDNDLNELLELYIARAIASDDAVLYPFGERWGPEIDIKDKYFGFLPGNGIHDIHMNQGNAAQFQKDNGVWQDGGLLIYYPTRNQWVGIFLAFQSQAFHTDDVTGNRIDDTDIITSVVTSGAVRIVAALVNPLGNDVNKKTVSLINISQQTIDLSGWSLADRSKHKQPLEGAIKPGEVLRVTIDSDSIQLDNNGGIITLLDDKGIKIHGVSYTRKQAQKQGWTIVF